MAASQSQAPTTNAPAVANPKGRWDQSFKLPNVGIHAHVLPNGKVLFWGRRVNPDNPADNMDAHVCTPFVWDPHSRATTPTPQPKLADSTTINLFCSGHTFLPDGRLLVVGGHLQDGNGLNQATIYDYQTNTWTPTATMNAGRWYPTAVTLPDGTALVLSGSHFQGAGPNHINNDVPQIWNNGNWHSLVNFIGLPLFPRLHVAPDGRVFMSGELALTQFLDTKNPIGQGTWTPLGSRISGKRDYAPSVMYDVGKIIYIGGGNNPGTNAPTNAAEIIDLNDQAPIWRLTAHPMNFPRRQHNATLLPDGTVLVTGGTRGGGGPNNGFNDLTHGQPVHEAELWDPATGNWTILAAEDIDRCYHATAVLLPDATVLSAGGGEYRPDSVHNNAAKDTHREAQIFHPPYLFKGPRPAIDNAPAEVGYGQTFEVGTPQPNQIRQVTWIRLPSVTHSFDQNQRINFLKFTAGQQNLTVTAPPNPNVCPPGHYMLFLLNRAGVPSVAKFVKIGAAVAPAIVRAVALNVVTREGESATEKTDQAILAADKGTLVEVGLTSTCPYGLSACWGGAYEGLRQLRGVKFVRPIANAEDSTAYVYLTDDGLPDIDQWPSQFASTANAGYAFRGVEVTLRGTIEKQDGHLFLQGNEVRPSVLLAPLQGVDKVQWDRITATARPAEEDEVLAYQRLEADLVNAGAEQFEITGPLKENEGSFVLHVRKFQR